MNTKHDSLNVSEVLFVLVYQNFDCKALIKNDILREDISQSGRRKNERKICERKQTNWLLVRSTASEFANVATQTMTV